MMPEYNTSQEADKGFVLKKNCKHEFKQTFTFGGHAQG